MKDALRARRRSLMRDEGHHPSVAIAVVHEGEVAWTETTGYRDPQRKTPADENTLYALASCLKPLTAQALLTGLRLKNPSWNAYTPIVDIIPGASAQEDVTVAHLLGHQAALISSPEPLPDSQIVEPEGWDVPLPAFDERRGARAMTWLARNEFVYSNDDYWAAGYLLTRLALPGSTSADRWPVYWDEMRRILLDPLGMQGTFMDVPAGRMADMALPFAWEPYDPDPLPYLEMSHARFLAASAAEAYATIGDMARWLRFQARGEACAVPPEPVPTPFGWLLHAERRTLPELWHDGAKPGFQSVMAVDTARRSGICLLSNLDGETYLDGAALGNARFTNRALAWNLVAEALDRMAARRLFGPARPTVRPGPGAVPRVRWWSDSARVYALAFATGDEVVLDVAGARHVLDREALTPAPGPTPDAPKAADILAATGITDWVEGDCGPSTGLIEGPSLRGRLAGSWQGVLARLGWSSRVWVEVPLDPSHAAEIRVQTNGKYRPVRTLRVGRTPDGVRVHAELVAQGGRPFVMIDGLLLADGLLAEWREGTAQYFLGLRRMSPWRVGLPLGLWVGTARGAYTPPTPMELRLGRDPGTGAPLGGVVLATEPGVADELRDLGGWGGSVSFRSPLGASLPYAGLAVHCGGAAMGMLDTARDRLFFELRRPVAPADDTAPHAVNDFV